jgi:hypothetical protein
VVVANPKQRVCPGDLTSHVLQKTLKGPRATQTHVPFLFDIQKGRGNFHGRISLDSLNKISFIGASGIIKFLPGSCLSELGIVLKEPYTI